MSKTESELDELQFCPICQIPLRLLKIIFTVHISMCDIRWDELPDCSSGIECCSESVFHYRDFSHKVLADHRENLRKRKIEEVYDMGDVKLDFESKENHKKVVTCQELENEDDVFVSTNLKRVPSQRNQNVVIKCTSRKQEVRKYNFSNECESNQSQENNVVPQEPSTSIHDEEINVLTEEQATLFNNSQDSKCENDSLIYANKLSSSWENLAEKIDKSVEKKEKCKAQWNNLFKGNTSTTTGTDGTSSKTNKKKRYSMFSSAKETKSCPSFKKLPGTSFAVDAFQFGNIPGITTYFLTHFHSDHYIGLKKSFSNPIYCSLITANLVKKKLRVDGKYLHVLELNQPIVINRVEVTCFDANHCPGAVIILFRLMNGEQFLHVGDFRACSEMETIPQLLNSHIDRLYLDTTYFNPDYVFPTQKEVVKRVKSIVRNVAMTHEKALFISGTYSIGKEKVFVGMLEELRCKLWAQPQKVDIFQCINDPVILSALTKFPEEAKIHVLPMNYLRFDKLKKYLLDLNGVFSHIFAFKPTGWEMGRRVDSEDWINESSNSNITIYGVPYSEHSNYEELCRFIKFIKADKVIPTVTMKNREMYGILKSIVDSYKSGPKQQRIQQFFSNSSPE